MSCSDCKAPDETYVQYNIWVSAFKGGYPWNREHESQVLQIVLWYVMGGKIKQSGPMVSGEQKCTKKSLLELCRVDRGIMFPLGVVIRNRGLSQRGLATLDKWEEISLTGGY